MDCQVKLGNDSGEACVKFASGSIEGRHHEASDDGAGCGARGREMNAPPSTRAAPGLRPVATTDRLPGAGPRLRKLVWVARREALRTLERECGYSRSWQRHGAAIPLVFGGERKASG